MSAAELYVHRCRERNIAALLLCYHGWIVVCVYSSCKCIEECGSCQVSEHPSSSDREHVNSCVERTTKLVCSYRSIPILGEKQSKHTANLMGFVFRARSSREIIAFMAGGRLSSLAILLTAHIAHGALGCYLLRANVGVSSVLLICPTKA